MYLRLDSVAQYLAQQGKGVAEPTQYQNKPEAPKDGLNRHSLPLLM